MRDNRVRVLLVIVGVGNAVVGFWAALAPHSFFDDFPGAGRHWVAVDGPFNEHLVRDVGTLNLALAAVALAALLRSSRYLVQVLAGAELVYTLPHLLYLAAHLDLFGMPIRTLLGIILGWAVVRRMPEGLARRLFMLVAEIAWRRQGKGVQQLEANLRRVVGQEASGKQLRELSRAAMRSYLRYWLEVFRLPVIGEERIGATDQRQVVAQVLG